MKKYGYIGAEVVEFDPVFADVAGQRVQISDIAFDKPATEEQYLKQEALKNRARVDAQPTVEQQLLSVSKTMRQQLIDATDPLAIRHMRQELRFTAPEMEALAKRGKALTTAQYKELEAYTQALRDLPTTLKTWPTVADSDWPKKPAFMEKSSTTGV
jgi:hypothetical protein